MYDFLQKFHSGWAYLALLLLVITVLNSVIGLTSKKEFTAKDRKIALFGLVFTHIQLLVGVALYFLPQQKLGQSYADHPYVAILAIVLITIGWSKHKKAATSESKYKTIAIFYGLGLLLILARIPWQLWFNKM